MSSPKPFKVARLCSLFLSFAFGVIGFSVGLNALVKFNQGISYVKNQVPQGTVVYVDIHDVFSTGGVITAVSALIAVLSAVFFAFTWCPIRDARIWFRAQSCTLFFCSLWLFATIIPFDYYFANHSAQISATLDGVPVSQTVIQEIAASLGFTLEYRQIYYVRLLAVLPWFTWLFAVIAGVVLHRTVRRSDALSVSGEHGEKLQQQQPEPEPESQA